MIKDIQEKQIDFHYLKKKNRMATGYLITYQRITLWLSMVGIRYIQRLLYVIHWMQRITMYKTNPTKELQHT